MNIQLNSEGRPKRPFRYIEERKRIKNDTTMSDERWNRWVSESIQYDKRLKEWQGNAIEDLNEKPEPIKASYIHKKSLIDLVISEFENIAETKYEPSEESNNFIKTLIDYAFHYRAFGQTESNLIQSHLLVHRIGNTRLEVKDSKGLWILGGFGIGKTKLAQAIDSLIFNAADRIVLDVEKQSIPLIAYRGFYRAFGVVSANHIKGLKESHPEKFLELSIRQNLLIDDLFTEYKSYGQEVISSLIEERYTNKLKTHIISNYQDHENKIENVFMAYGERYGHRLLDRSFEMFNVIELKDKSKRK